MKTHGGKRKGSGRKKKEPTVTIRVPKGIAKLVKKMAKEYVTKLTAPAPASPAAPK